MFILCLVCGGMPPLGTCCWMVYFRSEHPLQFISGYATEHFVFAAESGWIDIDINKSALYTVELLLA